MHDFADAIAKGRAAVQRHLGQDVTIAGRAVRVVWTVTEAAPMLGGLRQPMTEPACLVHPDDATGIERGQAVAKGGETFVIADTQPRTDGWLLLVLRAQA